VTNTLPGSIADSKLLQITTAGKVATSALTGTLFTLGTTALLLSTVSTIAGMVSITSTSLLVL
jgi:sulfite exporter TauE/SafE